MRKENTPKVSVITICFNAEREIEKTILSVLSQKYANIEFIVVDGASKDKTVDIIKKHSNSIAKWISEPDSGCYDAMNKGLDMATGEWIVFMNSGDSFYSNDTISQTISHGAGADVIYGDVKVIASFGIYELRPYPVNYLEKGVMPFCHQTCFVKTDLVRKFKFNTNYKISADFDLFHSIWNETQRFCYVPMTISIYDISEGSLSFDHHEKVLRENFMILGKKDLKSYYSLYMNILKCNIKNLIFKLLSGLDYKSMYYRRILEKNELVKSKSW